MAHMFAGQVQVATAKLNCVCIFDKHRRVSEVIAGAGVSSALTLNEPQGLTCCATAGGYHLFIADTNNHKVEKLLIGSG